MSHNWWLVNLKVIRRHFQFYHGRTSVIRSRNNFFINSQVLPPAWFRGPGFKLVLYNQRFWLRDDCEMTRDWVDLTSSGHSSYLQTFDARWKRVFPVATSSLQLKHFTSGLSDYHQKVGNKFLGRVPWNAFGIWPCWVPGKGNKGSLVLQNQLETWLLTWVFPQVQID